MNIRNKHLFQLAVGSGSGQWAVVVGSWQWQWQLAVAVAVGSGQLKPIGEIADAKLEQHVD